MSASRRLLLFTKPAHPGLVKTRLIGDLTAEQAAELHAAFRDDLLDRLRHGDFGLHLVWALEPDEAMPAGPVRGLRQRGENLGERLYQALTDAAAESDTVGVVGSDHPALPLHLVHEAFARVETGADVAIGPAEDGGYYLIALRADAVSRRLFEGIAWSTGEVLSTTLERCRELGLVVELLPMASDVDTPEDLRRLALRMASDDLGCPRTRELLGAWNRLPLEGEG